MTYDSWKATDPFESHEPDDEREWCAWCGADLDEHCVHRLGLVYCSVQCATECEGEGVHLPSERKASSAWAVGPCHHRTS